VKRMLAFVLSFVLLAGCAPAEPKPQGGGDMSFQLTSTSFAPGAAIPSKYSCRGENVSPTLAWTEPPNGTQSFALVVDDPDAPAGTWVHWVLFNLPPTARTLPEGMPGGAQLPDGSLHGKNSSAHLAYDGPCPPSGTHRYFFKLYALDTTLNLSSGVDKAKLLSAMEGHVLAVAELMGTFSK
jgi:Raf kinase inhibitor-like YbhB/YbcL family protein